MAIPLIRRLAARIRPALPLLMLLLATGLVAALGAQKRSLRAEVQALQLRLQWLHPGLPLATVTAETLEGKTVTLGSALPGHRQVLLFFNTTCPYCLESLDSWNRLAADVAAHPDVEVYALSFHSDSLTRAYALEHGLKFPIVVAREPKLGYVYRVLGVPVTAVLDHEGTVLYAGRGSLRRSPDIADSVHHVLARTAPR